jgi:hypothetical protein
MDIGDTLTRVWNDLIGRANGPFDFRLILQPTMASIFAIRDGLRDAREGHQPYFWTLFKDAPHRRERLKSGWKSVRNVFVFALVLDVVYEFIVFKRFYPAESLIVAVVLALVPYLLIRGPVNRIARRSHRKDRRTDRAA